MADGMGAVGLAGGFAKALSGILLGNRAEQRRRVERKEDMQSAADTRMLPFLIDQAKTSNDWSLVNEAATRLNPNIATQLKRNGGFEQLGPLLTMDPSPRPTPGGKVSTHTEMIPGVGVPSETMTREVSPKTHLLGTYMPTAEERASQATQQSITQSRQLDLATVQRAREILTELRKGDPHATMDDAFRVVGVEFPAARAQEAGELVSGVDATGKPATGIFVNGQVIDLTTKQPIPGFQRTALGSAGTAQSLNPEEAHLAAYARDLGKTPETLTAAEREDARKKYTTAGRAPETAAAGGSDPKALAGLAARNPVVLQGLTPTVTGAVMSAIAADPVLRTQYEQTRMQPIRESATTMLKAIDALLNVNPDTGEVAGLSPGATQLFGEYTPAGVRAYIPSGAAADANAALQQIVGQQIVQLIADMKAQSRTGATGFGQLNVRELDTLTAAATQLKQRLTEANALTQLKDLRAKFAKILLPGAAEVAASAGLTTPQAITLDTPVYIGPDGRPSLTPPGAR